MIPFFQRDFAVFEFADTNLRALQIGHDGNLATASSGYLAHQRGAGHMISRFAVREIETHDIDTGFDHPVQYLTAAGSGANGGNNLGSSLSHGDPLVKNRAKIRLLFAPESRLPAGFSPPGIRGRHPHRWRCN